ncbi:hypothetical protein OG225_38500 [Nocardia sp. NBC_01377]|uniref:hypothetical protein n=1 Tax=Nocardia TaxID=1817 RepID=UPI001C2381E8|nr:hypothetical protein [Nocardia noduli]
MGTVENYPNLLDIAAGKTGRVRDAINTVMGTLDVSLAGRGAPWGDDEMGRRFSDGPEGYLSSRGNLKTSAAAIAGSFDNFSTTQYDTARQLRELEEDNEGQFD